MRALALGLLLIGSFLTSAPARAADAIEYGTTAELRGIATYYVLAGTDVDLRNRLVEAITKELRGRAPLTVANRIEEAGVVLEFQCDADDMNGEGLVYTRPMPGTSRLLMRKKLQGMKVVYPTSKQFVKAFVSAYLEANAPAPQ